MPRSFSLIGWRRREGTHGIVLTMQLARSVEQARSNNMEQLTVALNDRQLRSLTRDLIRAADQRGIDLFHRPRGWRRLFTLFRG